MGSNDKASPDVVLVRPYAYSISLDCNAKGYIQPSIKMQSDQLISVEGIEIQEPAVILLDRLVKKLRKNGYKIATDIEDIPKDDK